MAYSAASHAGPGLMEGNIKSPSIAEMSVLVNMPARCRFEFHDVMDRLAHLWHLHSFSLEVKLPDDASRDKVTRDGPLTDTRTALSFFVTAPR